jgi:hypothetical protein
MTNELIYNKLFSRQFDKYATSIIDRCYNSDESLAVDLLKQPAVTFNNIVPLELAEQTKCRAFLASKSVQKYLDQKWLVLFIRMSCMEYLSV